jgi:hypothetical protein
MSAGPPRPDRLRVFLAADTPELLIHLHLLEEAVAAVEEIALEPILLEPLAATPAPLRTGTGREMREGDVLLTLVFDPVKTPAQLAATLERAHQRRLLLLSFHAAGGDIFGNAPPRSPFATLFDPTVEPAAVVRVVRATLLDVLALVSPQTDPHGRWPGEKAKGVAALELLRAEPAQRDGQLGLTAHESRLQAARAIEVRLFEPALAALTRALEYEATSAIGAFWRARLLAALGDPQRLIEARLEAARASRLARIQGKSEELAPAAAWLRARLEALSGEKNGLLEALAEAGAHPEAPAGTLLPALRFLVLGGAQEIALDWLRQALVNEVTVLDRALEDPFLSSLAPVLRTFRRQHRDRLRNVLNPLLESEAELYNAWPDASPEARGARADNAATDWNDAPLGDLQEAVQESIMRQLRALNGWSEELINDILAAEQARTEQNRLAEVDASIPDPKKLDFMLEGVWPRLREKRDELAAALRESERESMRLEKQATAIGESLGTRLAAFLKCARRFEAQILQAPEQVSAINARAGMETEPLRVATIAQLDEEGITCHHSLLPDALAAFTDEVTEAPAGPALFRLEPQRSTGPVASRAGVYFQRAYRRSIPGRIP